MDRSGRNLLFRSERQEGRKGSARFWKKCLSGRKQGHYTAGQVANIVSQQAKHVNAPKLLMRATVAGGCENNAEIVKGRMLR